MVAVVAGAVVVVVVIHGVAAFGKKTIHGLTLNELTIDLKTSLTEFRRKMRSGDQPAYLYLNGIFIGIVSCS